MHFNIFKDYNQLSFRVAELILDTIRKNPAAVLCLATGDTPRLAYQLMTEKAIAGAIDFSKCTFIGLDEWVGISPQNEGSCHFFLESLVFNPLAIAGSQIHLFDGLAENLLQECVKMNGFIEAKGGIDLMIVGVGMNGHVGFNEPGISPGLSAHVAVLDDTTQSVGQKYFTEAVPLKQGITLGLLQVMQSRQLVMVANGAKKAGVIKAALEEQVTIQMPAGIIQTHVNGYAMIDEAAAAQLDCK